MEYTEESDDWWIELERSSQVVFEDKYWIMIESPEYHSQIHTHYIIYPKDYCEGWAELSVRERNALFRILNRYNTWDVYRDREENREFKRFCLHLCPRIDIIPVSKDATRRTPTTSSTVSMVGFDVP